MFSKKKIFELGSVKEDILAPHCQYQAFACWLIPYVGHSFHSRELHIFPRECPLLHPAIIINITYCLTENIEKTVIPFATNEYCFVSPVLFPYIIIWTYSFSKLIFYVTILEFLILFIVYRYIVFDFYIVLNCEIHQWYSGPNIPCSVLKDQLWVVLGDCSVYVTVLLHAFFPSLWVISFI